MDIKKMEELRDITEGSSVGKRNAIVFFFYMLAIRQNKCFLQKKKSSVYSHRLLSPFLSPSIRARQCPCALENIPAQHRTHVRCHSPGRPLGPCCRHPPTCLSGSCLLPCAGKQETSIATGCKKGSVQCNLLLGFC